jgi:predicted nucleotidyltransferase
MTVRDQVHRIRRELLAAAAEAGAQRVRLFGSVARGDDRADSDVDLLVQLAPGRTLLDLARLETRLEQLLQRPVEVVPEAGLREPFRSAVLRDAVDV